MAIEEIETQLDGEWVLIGGPKSNEYLEVVRGEVLSHSVDRSLLWIRSTLSTKFMRTSQSRS